jgi:hypothetical protein
MTQGSDKGREPLLTDVIGVAVGLIVIMVAITRFGNQIPYLPDDPRARPDVNLAISVVLGIIGTIAALIGAIRLVLGIRGKN